MPTRYRSRYAGSREENLERQRIAGEQVRIRQAQGDTWNEEDDLTKLVLPIVMAAVGAYVSGPQGALIGWQGGQQIGAGIDKFQEDKPGEGAQLALGGSVGTAAGWAEGAKPESTVIPSASTGSTPAPAPVAPPPTQTAARRSAPDLTGLAAALGSRNRRYS